VLGTRRDVQQQTIANKKRLEEKDLRIPAIRFGSLCGRKSDIATGPRSAHNRTHALHKWHLYSVRR